MFRQFFIVALFSGTLGQIQLEGSCRKPEHVVEDVNVLAFLGTWYQLERIPNPLELGDCSFGTYFAVDPTLGLVFHYEFQDGILKAWWGTIKRNDNDPEKFVVSYTQESYEYYLLATDYKEYALLYSCKNNSDGNRNVWGWKISRSQQYSPLVLQEVQTAVDLNPDLKNATWTAVNQKNCPF